MSTSRTFFVNTQAGFNTIDPEQNARYLATMDNTPYMRTAEGAPVAGYQTTSASYALNAAEMLQSTQLSQHQQNDQLINGGLETQNPSIVKLVEQPAR